MEEFVEKVLKKTLHISEISTPGWVILAKRSIVERTFVLGSTISADFLKIMKLPLNPLKISS
jgi:hypothetical protein